MILFKAFLKGDLRAEALPKGPLLFLQSFNVCLFANDQVGGNPVNHCLYPRIGHFRVISLNLDTLSQLVPFKLLLVDKICLLHLFHLIVLLLRMLLGNLGIDCFLDKLVLEVFDDRVESLDLCLVFIYLFLLMVELAL